MSVRFEAGRNIALKVPPHQHEATVAFYRDVLGLPAIDRDGAVGFAFGPMQLWIDRVPAMSQAELWLEVVTDDTAAAARHLEAAGVARCDAIEPLGAGFDGFWIASPSQIVHLVDAKQGAW
jgi:catechol 2,3-dioxygenase-like lactoylglutathione lyase family enzyme